MTRRHGGSQSSRRNVTMSAPSLSTTLLAAASVTYEWRIRRLGIACGENCTAGGISGMGILAAVGGGGNWRSSKVVVSRKRAMLTYEYSILRVPRRDKRHINICGK
jgi:hypothetical protein